MVCSFIVLVLHYVKVSLKNYFIAYFQEYMKVMRLTNPSVRKIVEEIEKEEIVRWSNSLTRAKVSRWGGMISTPDEFLQVNIVLLGLCSWSKATYAIGMFFVMFFSSDLN